MVEFQSMNTWAVVKISGKQYKIQEGETMEVDRIQSPKDTISFDEILLIKKEKSLVFGSPYIKGAKVKAKVLENFRAKKIKVVKFKSKSKYLRTRGHRQEKTKVKIEKIES